MDNFNYLPFDLKRSVIPRYLPINCFLNYCSVNRSLSQIVNNNNLWRYFIERDYSIIYEEVYHARLIYRSIEKAVTYYTDYFQRRLKILVSFEAQLQRIEIGSDLHQLLTDAVNILNKQRSINYEIIYQRFNNLLRKLRLLEPIQDLRPYLDSISINFMADNEPYLELRYFLTDSIGFELSIAVDRNSFDLNLFVDRHQANRDSPIRVIFVRTSNLNLIYQKSKEILSGSIEDWDALLSINPYFPEMGVEKITLDHIDRIHPRKNKILKY